MSLIIPPRKSHAPLESEILDSILRAVNATGYARCWRNNVGKLPDANGRVVSYGLAVGSADLIGIVRVSAAVTDACYGRFLALEVKRPGKLPTDDQRRWLAVVANMGAVAAVVHSADEALAVVAEARDGKR